MERLFEPGPKGAAVALRRERAKEAAVREQERVRWLRRMRSQQAPVPNGWIRWRSVLPQTGWDVWYEGAGHARGGIVSAGWMFLFMRRFVCYATSRSGSIISPTGSGNETCRPPIT